MATLNTRIILRNDSTANWLANDTQVLLKGEVGIEFLTDGTVKMKVGDGTKTWAELPYFGGESAHVYEATLETDETKEQAIARVVGDNTPVVGDIAIVKVLINGDKYEYTAYVCKETDEGTAWAAMDGNYNAESVYFDSDLLLTYTFGKFVPDKTTGNVTVAAAGKSIKDLLMSAYVDVIDPTITDPNLSVSLNPASASGEVGTYYSIPTATATMTAGTYSYGSTTSTSTSAGIVATSIKISDNKVNGENSSANSNTATYTISSTSLPEANRQITDTAQNIVFSAECSYPASSLQPVNNIGESADEDGNTYAAIDKGTDTASKTYSITGYRKPFWGYKLTADALADPTKITSAQVRALGNSGTSVGGVPTTFTVPKDTKQVYFAIKAGTKTSLTAVNKSALSAPVAFTKVASGVSVEGANGYTAVAYDLWYANFDEGTSGSAELGLTWK